MKRILFLAILFVLLSSYNAYAAEDIVEQRNFSVSAAVPPGTSDYQFSLAPAQATNPVTQSTTLQYVITYGAQESAGFNVPITLIADWRSSDAMTNIPVLDYVIGSGSEAYGGVDPVVDLVNRQITWTIPSLPQGTVDQTVTFEVRTNSNYTGDAEIRFTIRANMNNQYVTMQEQSVTKTYIYDEDYQEPVTITATPTPAPSSAPAPTNRPTAPSITNTSFTGITDASATILVDTSTPTRIRVNYGTSSQFLPSSLTTADYALRSSITLDDLRPATTYYLRFLLTDREGQSTTSEIFTFRTAEDSTPPDLEDNIIVFTSQGLILISDIQRKGAVSQIALLTPDSEYEFSYAVRNKITVRSIEAVIRNKVLGLANTAYAQESQTITVPMRERSPSVYVATLKTLNAGFFEVSVRIVDMNGNITEQKIAELKVISHFSVVDESTKNPISDSRVYFSVYNQQTKQYEPLPYELFRNVPNPSFTDLDGLVKITLPLGKYRAHVSAFGYREQIVDFTLGVNQGEDFPQISLQKDQANIVGYMKYYGNAVTDIVRNVGTVVNSLALSVRFFNILATFILLVTIGITFLLFSFRTRVYLRHIFPFFTHHVRTIAQKHPLGTFCATITDEEGRRVKGALISVLDDATGELLTSIASNTIGICYLFNPKEHKNLKLLIIKQGYQPKTVAVASDIANTTEGLTIMLRKGHKPPNAALVGIWSLMEAIAGRFFEVSLFASFLLELFFLSIYGFTKTLPFFVLSLFNLILWIFYQREKEARKVFKKPS